jgi:serine/threonine protein phosphatase PrpC
MSCKQHTPHVPAHMHAPALPSLQRSSHADQGLRGALEVIISEAFAEAEKAVSDSGVDLTNSGTTAAVAVQRGNQLWLAAAGDSRALLCSKSPDGSFRGQPLSLDHRPSRPSETARWGRRQAA